MSKRASFLLLSFLLSLATIVTISYLVHNSNHFFRQLGNWASVKRMGRYGLIGTQQFLRSRESLAGNRLNLSAWHGHNEVIWLQSSSWDELSLQSKIGSDAYLWIFFSQTPEKRFGIRISQNSLYPSGFYSLNRSGTFLTRELFKVQDLKGWNNIRLQLSPEKMDLFINGEIIFSKKAQLRKDQMISFRAGSKFVQLDDVALRLQGKQVAFENFAPRIETGYILFSVGLTLLLMLLIWVLIQFVYQSPEKQLLFLLHQIILLGLIFGVQQVDRLVWAPGYHYRQEANRENSNSPSLPEKLELVRRALSDKIAALSQIPYVPNWKPEYEPFAKVFGFGASLKEGTLPNYHYYSSSGKMLLIQDPKDIPAEREAQLRLAFLGASQMWGAGALGLDQSYVAIATRELNLKTNVKIASFNDSINGVGIEVLASNYRRLLSYWKPHVLVASLSLKDYESAQLFREKLKEIATLNQSQKIKSIFILEARDPEGPTPEIPESEKIVKEVAQQFHIPVIDLFGFINRSDIYDSGLIWWDLFHFDQHGHQIAGSFLGRELKPLLLR